ncbi:hypothetical protein TrRE_jg4990 [Triparma retinervis]|uniref:Uncharacterized protein n=1 Tax=Triparma retinervis TaxID=2557542 RepID=A0A9W7A0D8_9STRA|nr:hypothetical protein TrRE_jg4990 [Triparma retinervis]
MEMAFHNDCDEGSSNASSPAEMAPIMLVDDIPIDDFALGDESIVNTLFDSVGALDSPLFSDTLEGPMANGVFSKPVVPTEVVHTPVSQTMMYSHATTSKVMPPVADLEQSVPASPASTINYEALFSSGRNSSKSYKSRKNNTTTTRRRTSSNSNANMIDPPPHPDSNSLLNSSLFSPSDMSMLKALDSDDDEGDSTTQAMATEEFYVRPSQLPLNLPDFEVPNTPTLNSFTPNSSFFMPEIETIPTFSSSSSSSAAAVIPPPPNSVLTAASMATQYAFPTTTAEYTSLNTFFPPQAISTMTSTSGMVRDDLKMSLARGFPLPPPASSAANPHPSSPPPIGVGAPSLPGVSIPYRSSNVRRDVLPLVSTFDAIEENDNPPTHTSTGEKKDKKALASEAYERKKQRAKEGRIKLNESIEQLSLGSFTLIMSSASAFQHVAYFLTPACLGKMRTLGRTFRYAAPFLSDSTYRQLSVSRFGSKIKTSSVARLSTPWVDKYRLLISKNTPPTSLIFPRQMGSSLSPSPTAWVTMVERSNGETNRAVLQENKQYKALPVVLMRVLIQNTTAQVLTVNDQLVSVESNNASIPSFVEVRSDPRLTKVYKDLSGKPYKKVGQDDSVSLRMFESVIMEVNLHCQHCPNETRFLQYAKRMNLIVGIDGTRTVVEIVFFPSKLRKKSR